MTNELWFFLQGALIGAVIAIPVGPVALLCIRYALAYGWRVGIVAGLGTAIADGFYGGVAAFGAGFMTEMLPKHGKWFYLMAGVFLIYIGIKIFNSSVSKNTQKFHEKKPYTRAFTSTLFLTFASPITTVVLAGFFARYDFLEKLQLSSIAPLALGVMIGAFLWWVFLTGVVGYLRKKLNFRFFTILNKVSGIAIFSYGVGALLKFFAEIKVFPSF